MAASGNYFLVSSLCLAVFYLTFLATYRKSIAFNSIRYFFLFSILFSLFLPVVPVQMDIPLGELFRKKPERPFLGPHPEKEQPANYLYTEASGNTNSTTSENKGKKTNYLLYFYAFVTCSLFIRLSIHIYHILRIKRTAEVENGTSGPIFFSSKISVSFSFLNWVFIPHTYKNSEALSSIISHERAHTKQLHSLDSVLVELLTVFMWFNPVVWLFKKAMKQNHEYLADKGVLDTGIDRLRYQTLLLNYIAEGKLLTLSSGLNHSFIKKRIVMMTKNKINQKSGSRLMVLVPITAILILGISCINGQTKPVPVSAVSLTKMNVLYLGIDNPVKIAVSGYSPDDISVEMTNGRITGEKGNYIINPKKYGNCYVSVFANGKFISKNEYRIIPIPDPEVHIGKRFGGGINEEYIFFNPKIDVSLRNFTYNLKFEVVSFSVTGSINGFRRQITSNSNQITKTQLDFIKSLEKGDKFYIEEVQAIGPDRKTRELPTVSFRIE